MLIPFLKAKIHRATVTDANLEYQGSITIGHDLLDASGIVPFERVHIYNVDNGERFDTYAIAGAPGTICLNGAAAWKAKPGNRVIICSYCLLTDAEKVNHKPRLVFVDSKNSIQSVKTNY